MSFPSTFVRQEELSNEPDHTYIDLQITNNDTTGLSAPPRLLFNEIRNSAFLTKPNDYYISVVRFSLETSSLPVMIPQIQQGQSDPDLTIYSVTLEYTDSSSGNVYTEQTFLDFVPQEQNEPIAAPPLTRQDVGSKYYYIYQFDRFIEMLNTAFQNCFDDLNTAVTAGGDTLPTSLAPFMEWNPNANLGILNADKVAYSVGESTDLIKVFFNAPLYNLFSTFPSLRFGYSNIQSGKNFQLNIRNIRNTNVYIDGSDEYLQLYQEGPTLNILGSPISSIVFTTALIPIVPTNVTKPEIFNSNQGDLRNDGNNANISTELTDFTAVNNDYRTILTYNPSAEYRLLDLTSNLPLSNVEIACFWKDRFGNLNPFLLNSGNSGTLKIMFRKKFSQLYKNQKL